VVGWVVCCGVGWKEGEVNGRRVQENTWLSVRPAIPDCARPHANRMFRSHRAPRIELTGQNTNQPKREFLENRENREICKIMNNKQKCKKPELSKDPAKRKQSQENKNREQNRASQSKTRTNPKQNPCEEARVIWRE